MIRCVRGKITAKGTDWAMVETPSGVGYQIFTTAKVLNGDYGDEMLFHTHLVVRENAMLLYGFLDTDHLTTFEYLIQVNGVGPKGALAILNLGALGRLRDAIASGDAGYVSLASGVGKKTASKVVIELKDKLGGSPLTDTVSFEDGTSSEVVEALVGLGYSQLQAKDVLATIDTSLPVEEQIRKALQLLGVNA